MKGFRRTYNMRDTCRLKPMHKKEPERDLRPDSVWYGCS